MSEDTYISTATDLRPVPKHAASLAARLAAHHWAPLPVVLIAPCMVVLDFFIVNVAVPSMQSRLHAGGGAVEWVIAGHGLTFAIGLITGGRLGDRFGRRRMFSGQLIGGALIQADPAGLGWRSVFVINIPIGIADLALAPRLVPESRRRGAGARPDRRPPGHGRADGDCPAADRGPFARL